MTSNLDRITRITESNDLVLTCCTCTTQREAQPFESQVQIGGRTNAWCGHCRDTIPHLIGIKIPKIGRPNWRPRS